MNTPVAVRRKSEQSFRSGIFFCLVILLALLHSSGAAGAEVSAAYSQAQGTVVVVAIEVGAPPPASLILIQNLPPDVTILSAQPPVNHVNPGRGEAKWLLRDIAPGPLTITMTLDRPVQTGDISGEIRFMPARGGGMQTMPVAKPIR